MSSFVSARNCRLGLAAFWLTTGLALGAQVSTPQDSTTRNPTTQAPAPSMIVSLDQAIELAKNANPTLQANRTLISQNQEQEVTANLRLNPVLSTDAQYLPLFNPSLWSSNYIRHHRAV
jgi:outer membrane protein, heavy metal efflux system